jgi:hypothetical protein
MAGDCSGCYYTYTRTSPNAEATLGLCASAGISF